MTNPKAPIIVPHEFAATPVRPAYTVPAVHVGGFRWEPVYRFRDRPCYVSGSVRERNPRGGSKTTLFVRYVDDADGVERVSATQWGKGAKEFTAATPA